MTDQETYKMGHSAQKAGDSIRECPQFRRNSAWEAWIKGWNHSKEDIYEPPK